MFLIFGRTGWIGGLVGQHLKEQGCKYEFANCRLEDRAAVISEIERVCWFNVLLPCLYVSSVRWVQLVLHPVFRACRSSPPMC